MNPKAPETQNALNDKYILIGRNAVLEALTHQKALDKILLKKGERQGSLIKIMAIAKERGIIVQEVEREQLDKLSESPGTHQGVLGVCPAKAYVEIDEILRIAKNMNEAPFVILLNGIMDPHNLGAILRSAEAAGVHGVIISKHRSVGLTPAVVKTSSGATEHIPVCRVANINDAIVKLKQAGLWITCADMSGTELFNADLSGAVGLVIGSEGEGVSRLTAKNCDFKVRIPMYGKIGSLNASVAAAIMMYEVVRRRKFSGASP
ncbi:MAG: 23S rRNA (guanosine(2251)-2'-O)-methyltransferase RlmB [Clostridiales bacterium]|jgi:23S rRNA (guanosine2251-2'-O)-methyltransferase|nr:23S rRNA (guanosine(2251)-2'-O)-methyltransferase RlmB [Clostridiales bacterium]